MAQLLVLWDGDCAFCHRAAEYAATHFAVMVQPYQHADLGAVGITTAQCATALQVVDLGTGRIWSRADAVAQILRNRPGPAALIGRAIQTPIVLPIATAFYRLVARNRHLMPGGTAACTLPVIEN